MAISSELAAFRAIADDWTAGSGVPVVLNLVPFGEILTGIDANLAGDRASDLFRVTYQDIGLYAVGGALLHRTDRLPAGFADAFRRAVSHHDRLYGVPHHTDTSLVLYDTGAVQAAGLTPPTDLDAAWSWAEFRDAAARLPVRSGQFPFAVNWQQAGAYRWLNWVAQNGGRLLDDALTGSAVTSRETREALAFTQSFFTDGLVPPTASTKGSYADELFTTGTVGMVFAGDFLLPTLDPAMADAVNTALVDRLEQAFLGGEDPAAVLDGLADDIEGRLS